MCEHDEKQKNHIDFLSTCISLNYTHVIQHTPLHESIFKTLYVTLLSVHCDNRIERKTELLIRRNRIQLNIRNNV